MKNSNQLAERRAAKQRAADYKAARNEPGADKGRLKRQFHKDKRNRRKDKLAEHQLNRNAWQRKHEEKKYEKAKANGTFKEGEHQNFINKTGVHSKESANAYDKYQSRRKGYNNNPGSLAAMTGFKGKGRGKRTFTG